MVRGVGFGAWKRLFLRDTSNISLLGPVEAEMDHFLEGWKADPLKPKQKCNWVRGRARARMRVNTLSVFCLYFSLFP